MKKYNNVLPISLFLPKDQFFLLGPFKIRIPKSSVQMATIHYKQTNKKQADLRVLQTHPKTGPTLNSFVNCLRLCYFME